MGGWLGLMATVLLASRIAVAAGEGVFDARDTGVARRTTRSHAIALSSLAFLLTLQQEWVRILVTCEGEFDAGGSQLP